jgi:hypothetical protein
MTAPLTPPPLNSYRTGPDERGHFGLYGGRYVAETLMPLILPSGSRGTAAGRKSISSAKSSITPARTR